MYKIIRVPSCLRSCWVVFYVQTIFIFFIITILCSFSPFSFLSITPQNSVMILPLNNKTNLHSTITEDDDGRSRSVRVWNYLLFYFTIFIKQIFLAGILMLVTILGKFILCVHFVNCVLNCKSLNQFKPHGSHLPKSKPVTHPKL